MTAGERYIEKATRLPVVVTARERSPVGLTYFKWMPAGIGDALKHRDFEERFSRTKD